jgi:hypothetical protein
MISSKPSTCPRRVESSCSIISVHASESISSAVAFGIADEARHRLSLGGSEKMQLTALLGAFKIAVELSQKKAK